MKPCPQCNYLLEDDMKFCQRCGYKLPVEIEKPVIDSVPAKHIPIYDPPVRKKKKKSYWDLALILAIFTFVVGISLQYTYDFKKPTKTINTTKPLAFAITFTKSNLNLRPGKSRQIDYVLTPGAASKDDIKWSSSNSSIVKVENGLATAVKPGKATITVIAGQGVSDKCEITVPLIEPSSLKFSDSTNTYIYVNKPLRLNPQEDLEATPYDAYMDNLVWISSDEQIATVDGGLIQGLQDGKVTITAKTESGVEASKEYTVSAVEPESVTLDYETLELIEGSTHQLYATVEPSNAKTELFYSGINVDENGLIIAKYPGTYMITVTTSNNKFYICELVVKKQSPVTIINMKYNIDFVGGVEWSYQLRNNTDREIKYINLSWNCYNGVGDLIKDSITGQSSVSLQFTGPLAPMTTTSTRRNATKFYNSTFKNLTFTRIEVIYMGGRTERINNREYVGWTE